MMLYRGIEATYETIREWCQQFGQEYANQLRRKAPTSLIDGISMK